MISWLLSIAHIISEIVLQFMRGLYDGQPRPLISIMTHFLFNLLCFRLHNLKITTTYFEL